MKNWKLLLLVVCVIGAAGAGIGLVVLTLGGDDAGVSDSKTLVSRGKPSGKNANKLKRKPGRRISQKKVGEQYVPMSPGIPPKFDIGDAEEAKLNEAQRKLLAEIRDALRREDRRAIVKFIRRIQSMDEWPDGIPSAIKKASLEALAWVGGGGALAEVVGFLGDADPAIVAQAVDLWEDIIADCDHDVDKNGEEGIGTHVLNASKAIQDPEAMESVLEELTSGCRHSVAVGVIVEILNTGSDLAKSKLPDVIEDLTGSEDITTVEQLEEWLKNNPDDPSDGEMYGGDDSSDDDD